MSQWTLRAFEDVKLTVALAATDADFEPVDYLRILIDPNNTGDFEVLAEFRGVSEVGSPVEKALRDTVDGSTFLKSDVFTDVTYDIPSSATELVVRFESYSTFPNEIVGIDNLRITSGKIVLLPGDFDGNGELNSLDIDDLTQQSASALDPPGYDLNDDTLVDSTDVEIWIKDIFNSWVGDANVDGEFSSSDLVDIFASGTFNTDIDSVWSTGDFNGDGRTSTADIVLALSEGGFDQGPRAAVLAVPEPSCLMLALLGLVGLAWGGKFPGS